MRSVDPLRPGQRIPPLGPESEVTVVTTAFNEMLDRVERERRESARREIAAQESERRHVAVELHDQIGQTLTAMVFGLGRAMETAPAQLRPELESLREIAGETIEDVRRLAARLRPEVLDALGLEAALTNLCARFGRQTGLRVVPELQDRLPTLSAEAQLVVYRVAQESLTNAARHANARRITVSLVRDGADLLLAVADDGVGFDGHREGGGIRGMRERALPVGAELDLARSAAGGVEVRLRVPGEEIEA
jgi:two-component system, NarL family, sensor histidine kinase UhpB